MATPLKEQYPRLYSALKRYAIVFASWMISAYCLALLGWNDEFVKFNGILPDKRSVLWAVLMTILFTDPFYYYYYKDRPYAWGKIFKRLKMRIMHKQS